MKKILITMFLPLVFMVVSCSSGVDAGATGDNGKESITKEEFINEACKKLESCGADDFFGEDADCHEMLEKDFDDCDFNGVAAKKCVDAVKKMDCDDFMESILVESPHPECDNICDGEGDTGDKDPSGQIWTDPSTGYVWSTKADTNSWTYYGALDYCNDLSEEGVSDWRLPTISELRTLIRNNPPCEYPYAGQDPWCEIVEDENDTAKGWSEACSGAEPDSSGKYNALGHVGFFWSSTIYLYGNDEAWGVNFYTSAIYSINKTDNDHINSDGIYVMCIALDAEDNGNTGDTGNTGNSGDTGNTGNTGDTEPWIDTQTGYKWSNPVHDEMDQNDAINYCNDLTEGGFSNWRLPTIGELRTLVENCPATETGGSCQVADSCLESGCSDDSCSGCEWADDGRYSKLNDTAWFLSSSVQPDNPDLGWGLNFFLAFVGDGALHNTGSVRCVSTN